MFIKLCLTEKIFRAFNTDDIISIDPIWFAEGAFECYHLQLATQEHPIELTEKQGTQLLEKLGYGGVIPADGHE